MKDTETEKGIRAFESKDNWELSQRISKALASSDIVPAIYKNNIPNTLIALEMANRIGMSPLMVMQHLYIIHGKPSWSSTFMIAAINTCGRFNALKYKMNDEKTECTAYATEKESGDILEGTTITMKMATDEGWLNKSGSKWKTMPDLMLRYRAAAFWGRTYAPEITMGMQSEFEVKDVNGYKSEKEIVDEAFGNEITEDVEIEIKEPDLFNNTKKEEK